MLRSIKSKPIYIHLKKNSTSPHCNFWFVAHGLIFKSLWFHNEPHGLEIHVLSFACTRDASKTSCMLTFYICVAYAHVCQIKQTAEVLLFYGRHLTGFVLSVLSLYTEVSHVGTKKKVNYFFYFSF